MRFTDFKIVIDGKLEGDEDADSIKAIFGKVEKTKEKADGSEDQPPMMSPQQQEIELDKAEQGKTSDAIDSIVDDDEEREEPDPKDNLSRLGL
jgi:hypothetical protein|tara:strand:- start:1321 stop:1599 length:279 start_codon:yes stop_codon:yes gene_type:complete